jgi:hypothetical protein
MFFMKGLRPERYRDNQAGITFQGPTQINITIKGDSSPQALITRDDKKMMNSRWHRITNLVPTKNTRVSSCLEWQRWTLAISAAVVVRPVSANARKKALFLSVEI